MAEVVLAVLRAVVLVGLLLAWPVAGSCAPAPEDAPCAVLPAGAQESVLAWLRPLHMDADVLPGWRLQDVGLERSRLRLGVVATAGARVGVEVQAVVAHACDSTAGELLGGVRLSCPAAYPQVCDALRQQLRQPRTVPLPWTLVPQAAGRTAWERPPEPWPGTGTTAWARATLLVVWLLAAAAALALLWQRRRELRARWHVGLLAIVVVGALLRVVLAPRGLQHELFHAADSLAFLRGHSVMANGEALPALVTAVAAALAAVVGPHVLMGADSAPGESVLYATIWAFSALTPAVAGWLAWRLHRRPLPALLAAWGVALLPNHVHFARSEEFGPAATTLALLSAAALLDWTATRAAAAGVLAVTATVLAMQSRPEFALLPLWLGTLLLAVRAPLRPLRARHLLLVFLGVLACWHMPLDARMRHGPPSVSPLAHATWASSLIWVDTGLYAWLIAPFVALGTLVGVRRRLGRTLWLAFWALGLAVLLLFAYASPGAYAWRVQLLPAALGILLVLECLPRSPRPALAVALLVAVACALQLWLARAVVAQPSMTELEYRFVIAQRDRLPPRASLLAVLSARLDPPPPLGGLEPGQTRVLYDAADLAHLPPAEPSLVYLQTAACWVPWPGQSQALSGMQPACQAIHDRYALEPLAIGHLPPRAEPPLAWAPPPSPRGYPIGYFRVHARR